MAAQRDGNIYGFCVRVRRGGPRRDVNEYFISSPGLLRRVLLRFAELGNIWMESVDVARINYRAVPRVMPAVPAPLPVIPPPDAAIAPPSPTQSIDSQRTETESLSSLSPPPQNSPSPASTTESESTNNDPTSLPPLQPDSDEE
jgi:hypothetical protein